MDNPKSFSSLYGFIRNISIYRGCSVIPLTGKRPPKGFPYSKYHHQHPTVTDLAIWFGAHQYQSYGVLCGPISGDLLVLDFDAKSAYEHFQSQFSFLKATYSVKTRRGIHVYFRSPQSIRTRKIPGGELLASGSLVVGAGSVVNEHRYSVAVDEPIQILSVEELASLLRWADADTHIPITTVADVIPSITPTMNHLHLITLYRTDASQLGRNNALYRTALSAAKRGLSHTDTLSSLVPVHITMPANGPHPQETAHQRHQEARDTIASAYRRAHTVTTTQKSAKHDRPARSPGLPNGIRERLIQQGSTIAARLLDAFILSGWTAGHSFTTGEAVTLGAAYGLGRSSILSVLSGQISQQLGAPLIKRASHSHETSSQTPERESDNRRLNDGERKPVRAGRRAHVYCVPSLAYLQTVCQLSDDEMGSCDSVTTEDLKCEKTYRLALHRELIKREEPELSYQWHAQRLHVCQRTIYRYNQVLGVAVTPIIGYEPLTWPLLNQTACWPSVKPSINPHRLTPGQWLQTAQGKRYPARIGIGAKLLGQKQIALLCCQKPSRFQLPAQAEALERYACVWRRLDGSAADWGGGLYDDPVRRVRMSVQTPSQITASDTGNEPPDPVLNQFINWFLSRPQDLTVIKGIGTWYEKILNEAGITRYEQLAATEPDRIARLSRLGDYVTPRQVEFWIDQARVCVEKRVTVEELRGWSFKDWKNYQMEVVRIERANPRLKMAMAREFKEKGWLKYHGTLPGDFLKLMQDLLL